MIALTYPTLMREAVWREDQQVASEKEGQGRRRQRTMNKSLELSDFSHYILSFPPSLYFHLCLSLSLDFSFASLPFLSLCIYLPPKTHCRLVGSSHVVANTSSLTDERAESERRDSTSPLMECRIHLNTNNPVC